MSTKKILPKKKKIHKPIFNEKSSDEDVILKNYTNPKFPGSFSGLNSFYRSNPNIKKSKIKDWALSQESYTLHKPKIKKFKRNQTIVSGINDTFQADLIDMKKLSDVNDDYVFLLTVICVFSKYAWIIPLKNKKSSTVIEAFKQIFDERQPLRLHTDQGSEFINNECKTYLKKLNIKLYFINSEMKAAIVERFNRTIKEKMWRYFTYAKTYKYINILDDLVHSYNNSYHRSIKTKPILVNKKNEKQIWLNLYGFNKNDLPSVSKIKLKFKNGDIVRISKTKSTFEKGYTKNWSIEIFEIIKCNLKDPPTYTLKDLNDEIIEGVFYEKELQKVYKLDDVFQIDQVLKKRTIRGKKQIYVSWIGYNKNFNSWIDENNLQ